MLPHWNGFGKPTMTAMEKQTHGPSREEPDFETPGPDGPEAKTISIWPEEEGVSGPQAADGLRLLFEESRVALALLDSSGRLRKVGPAFAGLLGYSPRKLEGKNLLDLIRPEERDSFAAAFGSLRRGEVEQVSQEFGHLGRKDAPLRLNQWIRPLAGAAGKDGSYLAIASEFRDSRNILEWLLNFRLAVDQSPVSVVITDTDGNIEYVNPKFTEITGYGLEEILGRNPRVLQSGRVAPAVYDNMWATISKGEQWRGELLNKKKNGELYWERASISPVHGKAGKITNYIAVKEDITERKRTRERLERELRIHSAMVRLSETLIAPGTRIDKVASLVLDMACRITDSGQGYVARMLPSDGEAPPEPEIVAQRGGEEYRPLWNRALETGEAFFVNDPAERDDLIPSLPRDSAPPKNFLSVPALSGGRLFGQIALANSSREYTESDLRAVSSMARLFAMGLHRQEFVERLKRAQEELEDRVAARTAELEEANRVLINKILETEQAQEKNKLLESRLIQAQKMEAIGTLAGGIAHDFNNILGTVIGNAELALYSLEEGDDPSAKIKQILVAGARAEDLVRQILNFSRQTGRKLKPIGLGPIVKEALKLLRASLPANIEIRQDIKNGSDPVLADATQIHQVLVNLCTNAGHAMRGHEGVLSVELKSEELVQGEILGYADLAPGRYQRLTVSDTGHGVEAEIIDKIFDPFFTTKRIGEGTGLGLSVVHGIVRGHGGAITVYSEPGKGTVFNVYLPLAGQDRAGEDLPREQALKHGTERILFVDDEKDLVQVGQEALRFLGYKVTALTSSLEALEVFEADPAGFDLVISDQNMPRLTGLELARKMLDLRPNLPIILNSGFRDKRLMEKAAGLGIDQVLTKPIKLLDMSTAIREALEAG